jgi:hypothetical protein
LKEKIKAHTKLANSIVEYVDDIYKEVEYDHECNKKRFHLLMGLPISVKAEDYDNRHWGALYQLNILKKSEDGKIYIIELKKTI